MDSCNTTPVLHGKSQGGTHSFLSDTDPRTTEQGAALKEMLSKNLLVWTMVMTMITGGTSAIKAVPLLRTSLQRLQIRLPSTGETRTYWREFKKGPRGWLMDWSISHTRKG